MILTVGVARKPGEGWRLVPGGDLSAAAAAAAGAEGDDGVPDGGGKKSRSVFLRTLSRCSRSPQISRHDDRSSRLTMIAHLA